MHSSVMSINTLNNVNKWYPIVKWYQFIIQIDVFGTQNEMIDIDTLSHLISYTVKKSWANLKIQGNQLQQIFEFSHAGTPTEPNQP